MKKRDLYWVNQIIAFTLTAFILGIISLFNILQFNASYMDEECEELQVFKRQIEWTITPYLEQKKFSILQKYCNDFINEDVEFRIFDENKNIIASSNPMNKSELLEKDSKIVHKKYNKFKIYKYAIKDRKIGIVNTINTGKDKYYLELTVSQADVMKSIIIAQRNLFIFFTFCIALFIIGLIQVFYKIRNNFNKLEDSVIEVANGNLSTEIEVPQLDLLKELTLSIKKMVQRLKTQITRLTQLEEYKSNFLQNITHEIKTPITAINSAIELLETRNSITEEDRECFDIIQFQIKSIDKLVSDILYLSETEVAQTDEYKNFETFDLTSMLKRLINCFNYTNIKINLIQKEQPVKIYANREALTTAFSNLITNAIRYSETDNIDIILNKKENNIELIVKDYGIGISKNHLSHIFEKFYRIDKNRSRKLGGSGLGLAIVKNIIELHKGTIKVESDEGKGTSFIISLPLSS